MKLFLVVMSFFILMGCASQKCVQIIEIQYDEKGIFQEVSFYIGNLYRSGLPIYQGTIDGMIRIERPQTTLKDQSIFPIYEKKGVRICFAPADLKWGFYKIWMPDGRYMTGEGYGSTIYIRSICGYSTF